MGYQIANLGPDRQNGDHKQSRRKIYTTLHLTLIWLVVPSLNLLVLVKWKFFLDAAMDISNSVKNGLMYFEDPAFKVISFRTLWFDLSAQIFAAVSAI